MALSRLNLTPLEVRYAIQGTGEDVEETQLDGGGPRQRVDVDGAVRRAQVRFSLSAGQQTYLNTFLHANRGKAFELKLTNEYGEWQVHEVRAVPGSLGLAALRGTRRIWELDLYVEPLPRDADFDASLLVAYETFGEDASSIIDLIDEAVNVHIAGWAS